MYVTLFNVECVPWRATHKLLSSCMRSSFWFNQPTVVLFCMHESGVCVYYWILIIQVYHFQFDFEPFNCTTSLAKECHHWLFVVRRDKQFKNSMDDISRYIFHKHVCLCVLRANVKCLYVMCVLTVQIWLHEIRWGWAHTCDSSTFLAQYTGTALTYGNVTIEHVTCTHISSVVKYL